MIFFHLEIFPIFGHQNPGSGSGSVSGSALKPMRIHNTDTAVIMKLTEYATENTQFSIPAFFAFFYARTIIFVLVLQIVTIAKNMPACLRETVIFLRHFRANDEAFDFIYFPVFYTSIDRSTFHVTLWQKQTFS